MTTWSPAELKQEQRLAMGRGAGMAVLVAVPVLLLGVFFLYPVGTIISLGLVGPDGLDTESLSRIASRARFWRIGWFTVWQAALSAAVALALGVPGAFILYRRTFRGRAALRALVTVPFVLPTVVVGLAFRTLFAPNGWLGALNLDGSVTAIIIAHVFFNYAVVVRTVGGTWAQLDERPVQAARSLGAGPVRAFVTVTLPALGPALAAAAVMAFLFCATSFGVILVMGGSRWNTIETEIYRQTAQVGDLPAGALLSLVQIALVTVVLVVAARLRRRTEQRLRLTTASAAARPLSARDSAGIAAVGLAVLLVITPITMLVVRSLRTVDGWGWGNYRSLATAGENNVLLVPGTTALVNSLRSAAIAAMLAVAVGIILAVVLSRRPRGRWAARAVAALDAAMMLPLGVSAVTVGFGFLVALDQPPLDFRSSAMLVPIAQAMIATPLVVRMVLPTLRGADQRLRHAAALAGAAPVKIWRTVDLPLITRALTGSVAFALATGLGEFGATTFVARPETITLPVMIGRLITRPGAVNTGMALAAGVILTVACAAIVLLLDSVASRGGRDSGMGGF